MKYCTCNLTSCFAILMDLIYLSLFELLCKNYGKTQWVSMVKCDLIWLSSVSVEYTVEFIPNSPPAAVSCFFVPYKLSNSTVLQSVDLYSCSFGQKRCKLCRQSDKDPYTWSYNYKSDVCSFIMFLYYE